MERQATQPADVPAGRKRRRACSKKNEEQKAKELETKARQPPTSELVVALNALPRAEVPLPPPQTLNELMDHTLKDYQEECVEEGTWQPDPATEVGEWKEHDLDQMKLSRTTKNYNKAFLSCGSFLPGQEPFGYFQWLHGPL